MEKILPVHLQEIIFSPSDQKISKQISKLEKTGKIRKIAQRIFYEGIIKQRRQVFPYSLASMEIRTWH